MIFFHQFAVASFYLAIRRTFAKSEHVVRAFCFGFRASAVICAARRTAVRTGLVPTEIRSAVAATASTFTLIQIDVFIVSVSEFLAVRALVAATLAFVLPLLKSILLLPRVKRVKLREQHT